MNNHSVCNSIEAENNVLDIIVVGGGINGAGIAVDAAGRGLKVGLYEAKDFASATSSASSKLIHGGLRYLEHYEFRLVGESLAEREVLLRKAPHIAKPMRFRLPHRPFLRPAWMIRAGLFLYDHLGKRTSLPASKKIALNAGVVTKNEMKMGFEYSDCWVDDARLVILNAMQARELGSEVKNYCRVESARRVDELWHVTLFDEKHKLVLLAAATRLSTQQVLGLNSSLMSRLKLLLPTVSGLSKDHILSCRKFTMKSRRIFYKTKINGSSL